MSEQTATNPDTTATNQQKKRRMTLIISSAVLLGVIAWAAWYLGYGRWQVSTNDAYVHGDLAPISSLVDATVIRVLAQDGDWAPAGTLLLELDDTDAQVALAEAKASLINALKQSKGLYTQARSAGSGVTAARAALRTAEADLARARTLAAQGMSTRESLSHAEERVITAQSALQQALEAQSAQNTLIAGTDLRQQPAVEAAAAQVRAAYLRVQRSRIVSPVDGYVARRNVQVGQLVKAGQPLLSVAALNSVWIEANYKETQLRHLRIGQPVQIHSDLYGSSVSYSGEIHSLGVGTGSVFAILPAQNATGNWIKITQRVPVRIQLTQPSELEQNPLRLGLSVTATAHTRNRQGLLLPQQVRSIAVQETQVFDAQLSAADALVADIISTHLPNAPAAQQP